MFPETKPTITSSFTSQNTNIVKVLKHNISDYRLVVGEEQAMGGSKLKPEPILGTPSGVLQVTFSHFGCFNVHFICTH